MRALRARGEGQGGVLCLTHKGGAGAAGLYPPSTREVTTNQHCTTQCADGGLAGETARADSREAGRHATTPHMIYPLLRPSSKPNENVPAVTAEFLSAM